MTKSVNQTILLCDWNQPIEAFDEIQEKERREKKSSKVNEQLAGLPARLRVLEKLFYIIKSYDDFKGKMLMKSHRLKEKF